MKSTINLLIIETNQGDQKKVYTHDWNGENRQERGCGAQSTKYEVDPKLRGRREEVGIDAQFNEGAHDGEC
jgi:hypothetical protein